LVDSRRRGKKTPTLSASRIGHDARRGGAKTGSACLATIRRSVLECRENTRSPGQGAGAQDSCTLHAVKAAERAGNARSTGARRSIRWQKSVRRIARLVRWEIARSRGGNNRVLARRKLEAPPDAGHERRKGETVRGIALTIKSTRWFGLRVSALRFSIRRKMFSGLCPYDPHRSCGTESFGSQVNLSPTSRRKPSRRKSESVTADSASVGTEAGRACPRVTTRASDGRHGSVKAPRGPRRPKGSSHPRR